MADEHDNIDPQAKTVRDSHPSPDSNASTIRFGDDPTRRPMNTEEAQQAVGDRYLVERLAGRGGMGQVFVAQDVRLQRQVAIKFISGQITDGGRLKLLQEARSMAGLQHPGICPVYEVLIDVERPFIVMGWVDGVPLDDVWKTAELDARLELLTRITEAVAEVHAAGLAHLDIKPSNILVDRSGTPVLVDFGLASTEDAAREHHYGGTPGYSAPEQFEPGSVDGAQADVHALGILLYLAMTDELPWQADTTKELLQVSLHEDPRLPEELAPGSPWPLQRIALVAIEREPGNRYPNAQALGQDLARYRRGETVSARPSSMMGRFHDQVRHRQEETEAWSRQGLVTHREAEMLDRIYNRIQRPESHWIVDSRRLTVSQIVLYLGGWFVFLAMTIGAGFSWDALESVPWLRYAIPAAVATSVLALGMILLHRGHPRIALGYLFTACLLAPVALAIFLIEAEWFADPGEHEQLLRVMLGIPPAITNLQLLLCGGMLAGAALWCRQYLHASAFTPLLVIGLAISGMATWATVGLLADTNTGWALFGLWLLVLGGGFLAIGIPLNRRQHRLDRLEAPFRNRIFDAWAPLTGGVLLCVIGMTLIAFNSPSSYLPGLLPGPGPHPYRDTLTVISQQSIAVALIINGLILLGLSWALTLVKTTACGRLAEALRWIIPAHIIGGLIELALTTWEQADDADAVSTTAWIWLAAAAAASLGFAVASVRRQWRPFLVSGMLGLGTAYIILMVRLKKAFIDSPDVFDWITIGTAVGLCLAGFIAMLLSPYTHRDRDDAIE